MRTILLLAISNVFMTFAWYGHLKYRSEALWKVIMVSWGWPSSNTAFRCPQIGSYPFTTEDHLRRSSPFRSSRFFRFSTSATNSNGITGSASPLSWSPRFYLSQVVDHRAGYEIFRGGHTRTSCLRAKCRSGSAVSEISKGSVMVFRSNSASARCSGHGG